MEPDAPTPDRQTILFGTLRAQDPEARLPEFRERFEACVARHRGRVHAYEDAGVLATFRVARAAVECAMDLQRQIGGGAAGLTDPALPRFAFGVHRGRVEFDGAGVSGSGVEVAMGLERLSDAGGVCISGTLRAELREEMSLHTIDVGLRELEAGRSPIAVHRLILGRTLLQPELAPARAGATAGRTAYFVAASASLVVLLAAGSWFVARDTNPEAVPIAAVAARPPSANGVGSLVRPIVLVVPFRNAAGPSEGEAMAGSVGEAIESDLLAEAGLQVVVPPPHAGFGETASRNLQLTRDLGARYALEGRVERVGADRLRIETELFDAQNGFRHFHAQYERGIGELPEVRRAIRERILAVLEVERMSAADQASGEATRSSQISRQ